MSIMSHTVDVFCVDESRVVLCGGGTDYIHANWVDVHPEKRRYVCTQVQVNRYGIYRSIEGSHRFYNR